MLNWKKSEFRPNVPFDQEELKHLGRTADGFFYRLTFDDELQLMTSNMNGAFLANIHCVRYDNERRFRLYSYKPREFELERHAQMQIDGFAPNRWYFVNRFTKEVFVANHNGETIKKALEGTEDLL